MTEVLTPQQRKERLFAWRDLLESHGVESHELPLRSDLETVAKRQFADGGELAQLLLTRKQLVVDWTDHLLWVLSASSDEATGLPPWGQAPKASAESVSAASSGRVASPRPKPSPPAARESKPQLVFSVTDPSTRFLASHQAKSRLAGDVTQIFWPARTDAKTVIYRVTARAHYRPHSPDNSAALAVTTLRQCDDSSTDSAAVRYAAIWTYCGDSETTAAAAQPELWAEVALVAPPLNVVVREQNGQVTGSWRVRDGIERVNVFRVPDYARDADAYPIEFQICRESDNLTGFIDQTVPAGRSYEYRFEAMAEVSEQGDEGSVLVVREIDVLGTLKAVTDLQIETRDDGYHLSWTAPLLGRCQVYQSGSAPRAGANDLLDVAALSSAGLSTEKQLAMPTNLVGHRLTMGPISKPKEWSRTHYSVAVIAGDRAIVGPSVAVARVAQITDAEILERVDHQLIVFDWPGEAAQVSVHLAEIGATSPPPRGRPAHATLTRKDFEERGGLVMGNSGVNGTGKALSSPGRVFLVPEFYEMGKIVPSDPINCDYPGLVRIMYRFDVLKAGRRTPGSISLVVSCERTSPPLPLTLVCHPDRLPLHRDDGTVLAQLQRALTPAMEVVHVMPEPHFNAAYARLFVAGSPGGPRIAVLDPPLAGLRLP
jgi:hypothetical protein